MRRDPGTTCRAKEAVDRADVALGGKVGQDVASK